MRVLLDTHVFLWWISDDSQLGDRARSAIVEADEDVFVSAASLWEIAIKVARGKLELPRDEALATLIGLEGFTEIPITARHVERLLSLPALHGDPFDRMIVAQAQAEDLTLVTNDRALRRYDVMILAAQA